MMGGLREIVRRQNQDKRIDRIVRKMKEGWLLTRNGLGGLGGWCGPQGKKDTRKPVLVSVSDMTEMLNRGVIEHTDDRYDYQLPKRGAH
jgi:hypothetical protein